MSSDVRFRILGSVGVSLDGTTLTVGAAGQRALLALLLLDANRRVHPHLLIDGIWGESCPQHPEAALQIVVSRLRTNLGALAERLSSDPSGYRLEVGDDELDLLRARAHYRACAGADRRARSGRRGRGGRSRARVPGRPDALADLRDAPFYDAAHRELRGACDSRSTSCATAPSCAAAVTSRSWSTSTRGFVPTRGGSVCARIR